MIVLPDSGSMTAANACGTSKYNILKERDSVFYQYDFRKSYLFQKYPGTRNKKEPYL